MSREEHGTVSEVPNEIVQFGDVHVTRHGRELHGRTTRHQEGLHRLEDLPSEHLVRQGSLPLYPTWP
jgi:hypothetical protein